MVSAHPLLLTIKGYVLGRVGRRDDAAQILVQLEQLSAKIYVSPLHRAIISLGLDDMNGWRRAIREAYEDRVPGFLFFNRIWSWHPALADPVYREIIAKIGLPQ